MSEQTAERTEFLFSTDLDEVDPITKRITAFEEARQVEKLIMIASESAAPAAVREALATVFTDLYAEGYPAEHNSREPVDLLADLPYQIGYHERFSDRRYYKGTEFADLVEALAQNRVRQLFAPNRYPHNPSQLGPEAIFANVQPLSGANANTAVYLALLQPGDTIMGLNLSHGGHLSHGSPANISGRMFKVIAYGVDPATGRIDYDQLERLAREHNPRMIVSGASAYPWFIDWPRLRQVCDNLPRKALLLADISHPAGLVAAGIFPNPVGIADVTTFTTHKTLIGPRAAVILTTNESYARRIDRSVFPGLQGGPHMNTIAALAVAFKIDLTPKFDELQRTIVANARALSKDLSERGLTIGYGGTETHLFLIDLRTLVQPSGAPLNGDVAARILDLAGVVANKNTIIGDSSAVYPRALRFGTPWITQRGLIPDDMRALGGIISDVLHGIVTFRYAGEDERNERGKILPDVLKRAQNGIADLIARRCVGPREPKGWPGDYCPAPAFIDGWRVFTIYGRRGRAFLHEALDGDVGSLNPGEGLQAHLRTADGKPLAPLAVLRQPTDEFGRERFLAATPEDHYADVAWWLKALSSGLVLFDVTDPWAKIDGPVAIGQFGGSLDEPDATTFRRAIGGAPVQPDLSKPYFIGQRALVTSVVSQKAHCALPTSPAAVVSPVQSRWPTSAEMAPDDWPMPRSFGDSSAAELTLLRDGVGVIDLSGLGIVEVSGPDTRRFLDLTTTNDLAFLAEGAGQYTFLLDPDGQLIADAMLYRFSGERYWLTTAPSQTPRAITWLQEALSGRCLLDSVTPTRTLPNRVQITDLRSTTAPNSRVCIGLAGPKAAVALRAVAAGEDRRKVGRVRKFTHVDVRLAGCPVTLARTTHTGVSQGYEIFVDSTDSVKLWDALVALPEPAIRPVGWDAWRAAGIIAGLPWDGRELGGPFSVSPVEAGYGYLVQLHKPFFVGRAGVLNQGLPPGRQIARLTVSDGSAKSWGDIRLGSPILNSGGQCVGHVTSVSPVRAEPVILALLAGEAVAIGNVLAIADGAALGRPVNIGEALADYRTLEHVTVVSRYPK